MSAALDTLTWLDARHEALRPYALAERRLLEATIADPKRLSPHLLNTIRLALNLARVHALPGVATSTVRAALAPLCAQAAPIARRLQRATKLDPASLSSDATTLAPLVDAGCAALCASGPEARRAWLRTELCEKSLVLALGGGGGTGYAHLGAFSSLEQAGLRPALIAGASAGALTGAFRARFTRYRDAAIWAAARSLDWSLFRLLDPSPSFSMPGVLRLVLREEMTRFFSRKGRSLRLDELPIPFLALTSGIRGRELVHRADYKRLLHTPPKRDPVGRLLHAGALLKSLSSVLLEISRGEAPEAIALGADPLSRELDVIDAIGLSCALPGILQYNLQPGDARAAELLQTILDKAQLSYLADGGITANVPAFAAWREVQRGRLEHKNIFLLALDCFSPKLPAHLPFMPLAMIAGETVAKNLPYADLYFAYQRPPSPLMLSPPGRLLERAIRRSKAEVDKLLPLLKLALAPLSPPPSLAD